MITNIEYISTSLSLEIKDSLSPILCRHDLCSGCKQCLSSRRNTNVGAVMLATIYSDVLVQKNEMNCMEIY